MRPILSILVFLIAAKVSFAQQVEETYPKTLWCSNDTFFLKFKNYPELFPYKVSREDKESPGTDAKLNEFATIYYENESLQLKYHNKLPYAHIIYINFQSPKGKTTLRFHFNELSSYFSEDYIKRNNGNIQFHIPEVYELANVIWTLSPAGQKAKDLYKEGAYYKKVVAYFKPYMNHPVIKAFNFPDSLYISKYYDFRENSFAFNFQEPKPGSSNTRLLFNGPYYSVYGFYLADSSFFGKLKPLVENFAAKSRFRQFYKSNLGYYNKEIQRQKELLPIRQMWSWLEQQFPKTKYNSYRIISSPLIGGSHSTQRFYTYNKTEWFSENVMFICGTDRYDKMQNLSENQKEGLMSGIVFTEIDHNYVNPATNKYAKQVDSIFSNRISWTKQNSNTNFYADGISIFNEYMTHAVFCLYVLDMYDKSTADFIIDKREELMVTGRNFNKFKEFNRELIRLHLQHKELKVVELYPHILEWCRQQH